MKNQRKRLFLCLALVLLCAMVLPLFAGCAEKDEPKTTVEETEKKTEDVPAGNTDIPANNDKPSSNGESLQSTPNKGGTQQVVSGGNAVKSQYSKEMEQKLAELAGLDAGKAATAAERRAYAEAYMRAMLTVKWNVESRDESVRADNYNGKLYYRSNYDSDAEFDAATDGFKTPYDQDDYYYRCGSYTQNIYVGHTYQGLPYNNGDCGLETFALFIDKEENDVYTMNFDILHFFGGEAIARVGTTAAGAVVYAWHTVGAPVFATTAAEFVPVNGFSFVGDIELPQLSEADRQAAASKPPVTNGYMVGAGVADKLDITYDGSLSGDTDAIVKLNGEQKMYEAYAKMLCADALVRSDGTNDVMMAVTVNVVRTPDGKIDGAKSFVTVHYQTPMNMTNPKSSNYIARGVDVDVVRTFGVVDQKISFAELLADNFVPMTSSVLVEGAALDSAPTARDAVEDTSRHNASYLYSGLFTASRRVVWANATLTDSKGNVIFDTISLGERKDLVVGDYKRFTFDATKIDDAHDVAVGVGDAPIASSKLVKGETYHYVISLYLATGEEIVARDWTFTHK